MTIPSAAHARTYARVLVGLVAIVIALGAWSITAQAEDTTTTTTTVSPEPAGVGVMDLESGRWWLRASDSGATTSFYFGNPGDFPMMGDWDCDGIDTPGLYRQSDGFVYLRNSNTQGVADQEFYFGDPGDVPLAGDFDGDGCATVSIYRPSESRVFIINKLGTSSGGLGAADYSYMFGDPGDLPFVGDFDGDGVDTVGLFRGSTGTMYLRNGLGGGGAGVEFLYGDRGDRIVAGDWTGDRVSSPGVFRTVQGKFYLRNTNSPGNADAEFEYGGSLMYPVAGRFGPLPGGDEEPPRDRLLVAEFTTYHPCCQSRVTNIQLIADAVDGAIVQPGETFSLNDHVGQRTEAKGYVRAGAIIGGKIVCCDSPVNIGGGTSQFATTLYNAIFYGGYDEIYHRPHSLYFSRYPLGIEATLGYPSPDVVFRNDTLTPVRIDTSYTSGSIAVRLYGNNEGRQVTASVGGWATSKDGGTVTVSRTIRYVNGTYETERWRNTYKPMPTD